MFLLTPEFYKKEQFFLAFISRNTLFIWVKLNLHISIRNIYLFNNMLDHTNFFINYFLIIMTFGIQI